MHGRIVNLTWFSGSRQKYHPKSCDIFVIRPTFPEITFVCPYISRSFPRSNARPAFRRTSRVSVAPKRIVIIRLRHTVSLKRLFHAVHTTPAVHTCAHTRMYNVFCKTYSSTSSSDWSIFAVNACVTGIGAAGKCRQEFAQLLLHFRAHIAHSADFRT